MITPFHIRYLFMATSFFCIDACSSKYDKMTGNWINDDGNKIVIYQTFEGEYKVDVELNHYDMGLAVLADSCGEKVVVAANSLQCDDPDLAKTVNFIYKQESDNLELMIGSNHEYFFRQTESK